MKRSLERRSRCLPRCAVLVALQQFGHPGKARYAGARSPKVAMAKSVGKGEGELNIIVWAGYAENGSNDPKVDWVHPFEKQTGCKVNAKIGNTSDEMVQLMKTGQYDGVSASGDATLRLIYGGDVAPVNTVAGAELRDHLAASSRTATGTRSTARCTASRTAGAPTC